MCSNRFTGMNFESAKKDFEKENIKYRVVSIDNRPCIITCDYNPNRFNLYLENNIITSITTG